LVDSIRINGHKKPEIHARKSGFGILGSGWGDSDAFVWNNGVISNLMPTQNVKSYAHGINKHGQIVGSYKTSEWMPAMLFYGITEI